MRQSNILMRCSIKQRQPGGKKNPSDWAVFIEAIIIKCGLKQEPPLQQPREVDNSADLMTEHQHVCNKTADGAEFRMIISPLSAVSPFV